MLSSPAFVSDFLNSSDSDENEPTPNLRKLPMIKDAVIPSLPVSVVTESHFSDLGQSISDERIPTKNSTAKKISQR